MRAVEIAPSTQLSSSFLLQFQLLTLYVPTVKPLGMYFFLIFIVSKRFFRKNRDRRLRGSLQYLRCECVLVRTLRIFNAIFWDAVGAKGGGSVGAVMPKLLASSSSSIVSSGFEFVFGEVSPIHVFLFFSLLIRFVNQELMRCISRFRFRCPRLPLDMCDGCRVKEDTSYTTHSILEDASHLDVYVDGFRLCGKRDVCRDYAGWVFDRR